MYHKRLSKQDKWNLPHIWHSQQDKPNLPHMCIISKDIGINKENETCVPTEESVNVYRCERTTMACQKQM